MKFVWVCLCGCETECSNEDQTYGAIWHCEGCEKTFACVRPKQGGKVWINVDPGDVKFHRLLNEPEDEE